MRRRALGAAALLACASSAEARVAARCAAARDAQRNGEEVETLYTNGPAGGGGATKSMREVIAVTSAFVPREAVRTSVSWMGS